jgi:hypothetical protein
MGAAHGCCGCTSANASTEGAGGHGVGVVEGRGRVHGFEGGRGRHAVAVLVGHAVAAHLLGVVLRGRCDEAVWVDAGLLEALELEALGLGAGLGGLGLTGADAALADAVEEAGEEEQGDEAGGAGVDADLGSVGQVVPLLGERLFRGRVDDVFDGRVAPASQG